MKKIIITFTILLFSITHIMAQKYFDLYQNGKVTKSIATADIDSMNLTGNNEQTRKVNFYRDGKVIESYAVNEVDSIKVFRPNDEQLVYLGIVGFNQELYEKPIDILASSTSNLFKTYVGCLTRRDGTLLYYAVEHAIDILTQKNFTTPLSSVNLITFTDGLDQGSLMMNSNYYTNEQYLNAVNKRLVNTKVKGLPIEAYSLGLRGNDVTDYTQFQSNLQKLATSTDKAFEVNNMNDVNSRLKEISDRIISISNKQTVSMKIPGQSNGTLIRFTFNGSTPESSTMYIEGTFNLADRSLRNVTYHGIKALGNNYVQGTQDGIFVTFTFSGLQREDENGLIPTSNIRQYTCAAGSTTWQRNSEFTPSNNTLTTVTHSGAAIVLVLDCSSSLGSEFGNLQSYAQGFINQLANNTAPFSIDAPTNVNAEIQDDDFTIRVSWDATKHAESYDVYRSRIPSSGFAKVAEGVTSTSWVDEKPLVGDNYYYVCAVGHGLTSSSSTIVFISIPEVPAKPIDLGLPSGTKWASYNVGATKPEEYGGYYAWGETEEKDVYNESTYKYYHNRSYVSLGSDISGTEYDVAHVKWGGNWRMPTHDEQMELLNNCTSEYTTLNGVNGRKFTGPNGNSIFLPAAGYRSYGDLYNAGSRGYCWSSTQYPSNSYYACYLYFGSRNMLWYDGNRYDGQSVRPVVRN